MIKVYHYIFLFDKSWLIWVLYEHENFTHIVPIGAPIRATGNVRPHWRVQPELAHTRHA